MTLVPDASVALFRTFKDEATEATDALLHHVRGGGARAPAFWRLEVANVLCAAERRGRIAAADLDGELRALAALPIALDQEAVGTAFKSVTTLALTHRLSVYDAVYLELAARLRLPLATLDKALRAAAAAEGVALLP